MSSIEYDNGKTIKTRIDSIELQSSSKHRSENVPPGIFLKSRTWGACQSRFLICAGSVGNNHVICFLNGKRRYEIIIRPAVSYVKDKIDGHNFYVYALELHENELSWDSHRPFSEKSIVGCLLINALLLNLIICKNIRGE